MNEDDMREEKMPDLSELETWKDVAEFTASLIKNNDGSNFASECIQSANNHARKWFIIAMALLVAFVASNAYWIYEHNSYSVIVQDGKGLNNVNDNGEQGDLNNVPSIQE